MQTRVDANNPRGAAVNIPGGHRSPVVPNVPVSYQQALPANSAPRAGGRGHPKVRSGRLPLMAPTISGTHLLEPAVIDEPYGFYDELRSDAPVWEVPGTGIFTVATFQLLAEAAGRVEDFSSNFNCLLYRDENGMPCRLPFGDAGVQALATADPPMHALHRDTVFPELVAKRMAALEPDIVEIAEDCMAQALNEGPVDFMAAIGNVVPITMISRLIGFHDSDFDQLLNAAFDSTAMLGSTLSYEELVASLPGSGKSGSGFPFSSPSP